MRLGFFGGSFNPPHIGHLAVAEACREGAALDRVTWIPTATSPHKQGRTDVASGAERLALVRAAIDGNEAFSASGVEVEREGVSYTVDTLRALRQRHRDDELFWIVGGDSLASFATWREPREILRLATLVAYPRPGADLGAVPGWVMARTVLVEAPRLEISSTEIRRRLGAGTSVRYLVPDAVREAIRQRQLYRGEAADARTREASGG
ncbi:nicotinate-nucleotide adenylyltransferase [Rubricoccus marinus]|uniref:Probable nicotinate-nucleotide adenylyltransferase n=1 Tax=Rubricoccus marinus TaxID=716817 RepID=A0A259TX71_9BACT|nr:nicotinate-nucleotide adenylyltransferase [Rubricoccus marinus]OZC02148.1 nicotinate (nicotinamide) nucleotide adenylyltransferase [Rubricoccus marinus]